MTQQRGGSAGFFAVLLGRSTTSTDQTTGDTNTLSRNSNPLNNQLTSGPTAQSKTLAAYKAYPPPRVSGQTAFEAAIRDASRDDESDQVPRNPSRDARTNSKPAKVQDQARLPKQLDIDASKPHRKVAFNTPSSSLHRLDDAPDARNNVNAVRAAKSNARPPPERRHQAPSTYRKKVAQPELPKQGSRDPTRTEREVRQPTQLASMTNGNAVHGMINKDRRSRDEVAPSRDKPDTLRRNTVRDKPDTLRRNTVRDLPASDLERQKLSERSQQVQDTDTFAPPVRRPVPSFLAPVASTAGKFDSIEEPKARMRSQERVSRESRQGSGEQSRRPKMTDESRKIKEKTGSRPGLPPTNRSKEKLGSRPGPVPINRQREPHRSDKEASKRMQPQRSSPSQPSNLYNNLSRNPLASDHDHRPVISRGRS